MLTNICTCAERTTFFSFLKSTMYLSSFVLVWATDSVFVPSNMFTTHFDTNKWNVSPIFCRWSIMTMTAHFPLSRLLTNPKKCGLSKQTQTILECGVRCCQHRIGNTDGIILIGRYGLKKKRARDWKHYAQFERNDRKQKPQAFPSLNLIGTWIIQQRFDHFALFLLLRGNATLPVARALQNYLCLCVPILTWISTLNRMCVCRWVGFFCGCSCCIKFLARRFAIKHKISKFKIPIFDCSFGLCVQCTLRHFWCRYFC